MKQNRLLIALLGMLLAGCAAKQSIPVGTVPVAMAPEPGKTKQTRAVVEAYMAEEGVKLVNRGKSYDRVNGMVRRLTRAAGGQNFSYPVLIATGSEDVNAMAVEGNTIVVYEELLKRVPSDDELATVLAHEVAHIVANHAADTSTEERESEVKIGSALLGAAASIGASLGGADEVSDLVGNTTSGVAEAVGTGAFVRAYDRRLEREADHVGLMIMARAGYNPSSALKFWERSDEIFGDSGGGFFSTHPGNKDRLDELKEILPIAENEYRAVKPAKR